MAMASEAAPIISQFKLAEIPAPWNPKLPMLLYHGLVGDINVTLTLCGKDTVHGVDLVATQPAVLATFLTIEHLKPDLIINAGTAGGFRDMGAEIGDVYLGHDKVFFHDRRIPIAGFDCYGFGGYACLDFSTLASAVGLKLGRISTGNSIDTTERDMEIMRSNRIAVKDMEAAAVGWVAALFGMPVMYLKAITDWVDHHEKTVAQFEHNLDRAIKRLTQASIAILTSIEEKIFASSMRRKFGQKKG
jgi:5'-methylthioadenosine nucleosidase